MSKTNYKLKECTLAFMYLLTLLSSGCTLTIPKFTKSSGAVIEKNKDEDNADKHSVIIKEESMADKTAKKQDTPFVNSRKSADKHSFLLKKDRLSEEFPVGIDKIVGYEELKVLNKVTNLEARLREEEEERKKTAILIRELNTKISTMQEAAAAKPGAGYLADGSTIGLGIVDGDDELRVLKKVKRLETRLEEEQNNIELLNKELDALKLAKENVENDLAANKKLQQENSKESLEKIKMLESTLKEMESRAVTAEKALLPIKRELLKVQISETKAQQELYKLKITKLQEDEE